MTNTPNLLAAPSHTPTHTQPPTCCRCRMPSSSPPPPARACPPAAVPPGCSGAWQQHQQSAAHHQRASSAGGTRAQTPVGVCMCGRCVWGVFGKTIVSEWVGKCRFGSKRVRENVQATICMQERDIRQNAPRTQHHAPTPTTPQNKPPAHICTVPGLSGGCVQTAVWPCRRTRAAPA